MSKFKIHPDTNLPLIRWHLLRTLQEGTPAGLRAVFDDERYELGFHNGVWEASIVVELWNGSGLKALDEWGFKTIAKDADILQVMAKVQVYAKNLAESKAAQEYEEHD